MTPFSPPPSSPRPRVAVVGAGICGLAAALRLAPHTDVTLFEALPDIGGVARALSFAGHRFAPGPQYLWGFEPDGAGWTALDALGVDIDLTLLADDFEQLSVGDGPFETMRGCRPHSLLRHRLPTSARKFVDVLDALGRAGAVISHGARFRRSGVDMMHAVARSSLAASDKAWLVRARNWSVVDLARHFDVDAAHLRRLTHAQSIFAEPLSSLSAVLYSAARHHLKQPLAFPVGGFGAVFDAFAARLQRLGVDVRTHNRVVDVTTAGSQVRLTSVQGEQRAHLDVDDVVWACSPTALAQLLRSSPWSSVADGLQRRHAAASTISSVCFSVDIAAGADRLRQKNLSWFVDDGDVDFDVVRRRQTPQDIGALNLTSPTLNAHSLGRRQVVCAYGPAGCAPDALVQQAMTLLRRHGVEAVVDEVMELSPTRWTRDFGAHEGVLYGRRMTAASMRRPVAPRLPPRWHLAHSGVGIPGVLGCLQLGIVTADEVMLAHAPQEPA